MGSPEIRQTVIGDHNIFTATGDVRINYHLPPAEAGERRILLHLADSVKRFWIEGVLERSLHEAAVLELRKEPFSEAVQHPWERILELPGQPSRPLASEKKIGEIFFETGSALLILGEPGAGKTVTLLELARELIRRFETDPTQAVPVVLNLSTWRDKHRSLAFWIEAELENKYFVPRHRSRAWLESSRLFPLLDGLDEVPAGSRASCVHAINEFLQNTGAPGIVVCSRRTEYTALPERLSFMGAVCLQPLTEEQIDYYLEEGGRGLAALRQVIRQDALLQELARSPLMLNVISLAYQDLPAERIADQGSNTAEGRRTHLFGRYVKRMFQRLGKAPDAYPQERTTSWLSWLARKMQQHSLTVFLIEDLQPSWLPNPKQRWAYAISSRVGSALAWAILIWILWLALVPVTRRPGVLLPGVAITVLTGMVAGSVAGVTAGRRLTSTRRHQGTGRLWILTEIFIHPLVMGAVFALLPGSFFEPLEQFLLNVTPGPGALQGWQLGIVTGLRNGLIYGLMFGLRTAWRSPYQDVRLSGMPRLSVAAARKGAKWGGITGAIVGVILAVIYFIQQWPQVITNYPSLLLRGAFIPLGCLAAAIIVALLFAFIAAMFSLFSPSDLPRKIRPGQGAILSAMSALLAGVGVTALSVAPAAILSALAGYVDCLERAAMSASALGVAVAVWYGGLDVIQHFTLRFFLRRHGYIPKNYVGFLDYASQLIFLQKVGSGYIFIHRQLLEYFSDQQPPETKLGSQFLEASIAERDREEQKVGLPPQGELQTKHDADAEKPAKEQKGATSKPHRRRRTVVAAGLAVAVLIPSALLIFEFCRVIIAQDHAKAAREQGDIFLAQGKCPEALDAYQQSLTILKRLADQHKWESTFQWDLSVSYAKVGNVLLAQGQLPEALNACQQGLAIVRLIADPYKSNGAFQLDLSWIYERLGDVLKAQGKLPEALDAYQNSFDIHRTLADQHGSNTNAQRNLSVSYGRLGGVLQAQDKLPEALDAYRQSLNIQRTLVDQDKSNAGWQRDLTVSYQKIGSVLVAQRKFPEALDIYQQSLIIQKTLADQDTANPVWQWDLSSTYENVGEVLEAQGKLPEALGMYQQTLLIVKRLAEQNKSNLQWKQGLGWDYGKLGDVLLAQGKLPEALEMYQQTLLIDQSLAEQDNSNVQWQHDLARVYEKVGDVLKAQGKLDDPLHGAIAYYTQAIRLDPSQYSAYLGRANAKQVLADFQGAQDDLIRYVELAPQGRSVQDYPHLFLWLLRSRQGRIAEANQELSIYLEKRSDGLARDWATGIAEFLLNKIAEADFVAAANSPDTEKDRGQHCEAWYYSGMKRLLAGDKKTAANYFRKCLTTRESNFDEYIFAQAELKRIGPTK